MNILVLGAGQLARMMALAGAPLNLIVSAYDVRSGDIIHPLTLQPLGHGLNTAIAGADIITAEFEHIPADILHHCEQSGKLRPSAQAILTGGDRQIEKALLMQAGVANTPYRVVYTQADLEKAVDALGAPLVLKSTLDGYDGKGQWRYRDGDDLHALWAELDAFLTAPEQRDGQAIIAEAMIPFDREVSLIGVRGANGEFASYSLTQNHHHDGILTLSVVRPDEDALQTQAADMLEKIASALNYVGVLAVEFFDVDGSLLVNEIAPRVHNSGHWTQQGSACCQFENHLRAVGGLPLGPTELIQPTAMINVLGQGSVPLATYRDAHVHWYNKTPRPGRKVGHINVTATSNAALATKLASLASYLPDDAFHGLKSAALALAAQTD
ncbi:5-(carboxyamino)imidazole ribonucleotide synthase [Salinivibrio sp. HTSP]|uniref:5-(carboxyamino)imidazole ribonucleotide synthase n=1 Tax=Salinivibrio sp. HTSP TaxID=2115977 RepID=UPI000E3149AA|nr:5-(carboxyamino)imidazole ribonucleotide synthase [Salinivibrio sp. HTSP]